MDKNHTTDLLLLRSSVILVSTAPHSPTSSPTYPKSGATSSQQRLCSSRRTTWRANVTGNLAVLWSAIWRRMTVWLYGYKWHDRKHSLSRRSRQHQCGRPLLKTKNKYSRVRSVLHRSVFCTLTSRASFPHHPRSVRVPEWHPRFRQLHETAFEGAKSVRLFHASSVDEV